MTKHSTSKLKSIKNAELCLSVCVLTAIFSGEPGDSILDFIGAKDEGGGLLQQDVKQAVCSSEQPATLSKHLEQ